MVRTFVKFGNDLLNMNRIVKIREGNWDIGQYVIVMIDVLGDRQIIDYGADKEARDHMFKCLTAELCLLTE